MGNLGGGEILVILLAALIFLGPEKLPEVARQLGKVLGEVRKVSAGFQREVHDAMRMVDNEITAAERERRVPPAVPAPLDPDPGIAETDPTPLTGPGVAETTPEPASALPLGAPSAAPPLGAPSAAPPLGEPPAAAPLPADVAHGGDR